MILEKVIYNDVTLLDLMIAAGILLAAVLAARILSLVVKKQLRDKVKDDSLKLVARIIHYGVMLTAFISVLPLLGFSLSGLLVAGGITGLVIGFAGQKIGSNLLSGIILMVERPVKIGQQVGIGGTEGYVEDVNILSTIIRTYRGHFVRVPNEKVFTESITNYVANVARRFDYTVGIRYSDDAEKAIEVTMAVIDDFPLALKHPAPRVFVDDLGDNSVNLAVWVWAPSTEWFEARMHLLWKIKKGIEAAGIQVPFPQRVVWFADKEKPSGTESK